MNDSTMNKIGVAIGIVIVLLILCLFVLLGWGFIELIQWITSK